LRECSRIRIIFCGKQQVRTEETARNVLQIIIVFMRFFCRNNTQLSINVKRQQNKSAVT